MIKVSPRARRHEDTAGDPLDGLVNLFDLGIVLAVGFLLAALASLDLTGVLTDEESVPDGSVVVPDDAQTGEVPSDGETVIGQGEEVGTVYRLSDGRLIYVVPTGGAEPTPSPSADPTE